MPYLSWDTPFKLSVLLYTYLYCRAPIGRMESYFVPRDSWGNFQFLPSKLIAARENIMRFFFFSFDLYLHISFKWNIFYILDLTVIFVYSWTHNSFALYLIHLFDLLYLNRLSEMLQLIVTKYCKCHKNRSAKSTCCYK